VIETTYVPFTSRRRRQAVRLIIRRVMPTPGSQLALQGVGYTYHAVITDREGNTLELEADHRRHAEIENTIRDVKYGMALNHMPSGRFAANAAWLGFNVIAHNLARWVTRLGLKETLLTTKTVRTRFIALPGRLARTGSPSLELSRWGSRREDLKDLSVAGALVEHQAKLSSWGIRRGWSRPLRRYSVSNSGQPTTSTVPHGSLQTMELTRIRWVLKSGCH
jgi:hypothetical protein